MNEFKMQKKIWRQLSCVLIQFCIFWTLALLFKDTDKSDYLSIAFKSVILYVMLCVSIYFSNYKIKMIKRYEIIKFIKKNAGLIILITLFITSSFSIMNIWFTNDGREYYSSILYWRNWNFKDFFGMNMCGHPSSILLSWYMVGEFVFPNTANGVHLISILLACLTILAMYGILRNLFPEENKGLIVIVTSVFAFSPCVWGMLGELNIDFPLLCALVWMIYFHIKKMYILQAYSGLLMCFSKETGIIIFVSYMIGWVLSIVIDNYKLGIKQIIKSIMNLPIIICSIGGVVWLYHHYFVNKGTAWSGVSNENIVNQFLDAKSSEYNCFSGWYVYMIHKIKEMLFINFHWIYAILALSLFIVYIFKEKWLYSIKIEKRIIIPVIVTFFGFYNFNLWFVTLVHYRYLIVMIFFWNFIFGIFVLGLLKNHRAKYIVSITMLAIVCVSNFYSDPISKYFFDKVYMGDGYMIDTNAFSRRGDRLYYNDDEEGISKGGYGDTGVTNRQYSYRGKCINSILKKIKYDENTLIIIPNINASDSIDFLYGSSKANPVESSYYVNKKSQILNTTDLMANDKEWIKFNVIYPRENEILNENVYKAYKRIYYVFFPINSEFDTSAILNEYPILEQFEVKKNITKFIVYRIK